MLSFWYRRICYYRSETYVLACFNGSLDICHVFLSKCAVCFIDYEFVYIDYMSLHILIVYLFIDGKPGGICSDSIKCEDINSACTNNVCRCNTGYTNRNGSCIQGNHHMVNLMSRNERKRIFGHVRSVKTISGYPGNAIILKHSLPETPIYCQNKQRIWNHRRTNKEEL